MGLTKAQTPRAYCQELIRFHQWRNQQLQQVLYKVQDEDFHKQLPGSFSSLHDLLNHMCWAEMVWFERIQGRPMPAKISLPYSEIKQEWALITGKWVEHLTTSTAEQWDKVFTFTNSTGKTFENNLFEIVVHLIDHASYHTGQAINALRSLDYEVVSTNFIHYLRAQN